VMFLGTPVEHLAYKSEKL